VSVLNEKSFPSALVVSDLSSIFSVALVLKFRFTARHSCSFNRTAGVEV